MNIPFNQKWSDNAHHEQEMRSPHMITKFANSAARKAGQIRGLLVEHHVSGWFETNYQANYVQPDNYQQWTRPCAHDFKLNINGTQLIIDVTGPKKDGSFGSYSQKPTAGVDFHIMCKPIGFVNWNNVDYSQGFEIIGVVRAQDYKQNVNPNTIIPFNDWLKQISL